LDFSRRQLIFETISHAWAKETGPISELGVQDADPQSGKAALQHCGIRPSQGNLIRLLFLIHINNFSLRNKPKNSKVSLVKVMPLLPTQQHLCPGQHCCPRSCHFRRPRLQSGRSPRVHTYFVLVHEAARSSTTRKRFH